MRCPKTARHRELSDHAQEFIVVRSGKPEPDFEAEEVDKFLDAYPDICLNCRIRQALAIHQVLSDRSKRFLRKWKSPYLRHVGKMSAGPCTGYSHLLEE